MADLILRDTDREELIKDTAAAVAELLGPVIKSSASPMLVNGDRMAELAGISRPTIDRAVRDGVIPSVMIGRARRFSPTAVVEALSAAK